MCVRHYHNGMTSYRDHVWRYFDTIDDLDSSGNNSVVLHVTHGYKVMNLGDTKEMQWICQVVKLSSGEEYKLDASVHQ